MSSKQGKMLSYDFPEEIIAEICKRLPVKYVLRCRSVQKSWYYLLQSPMFITLHLNHQKITTHDNPKYILFHNFNSHLFTVRFDNTQCEEYCTFDYPLDLPKNGWYAQSHGLICVSCMFNEGFYYNPNIYLWNPLVKKFKALPDSPLPRFTLKETMWKALAFGFIPEVNDYVVVHIVRPRLRCKPEANPHSVIIGVYSLNTNSWKKIRQYNIFISSISSNEAVFVNGSAFWVAHHWDEDEYQQVVICFDTKTDILRKISLPHWNWIELQYENPLIHRFGQSIAYFVEDEESIHLDMWVLKDNPINEFPWENKLSVSLSENVWLEVLGVRNNGEPILAKLNSLISYNLDNHEEYDFVDSCDRLIPFSNHEVGSKPPFLMSPFVETLVLLDIN